MLGRRFAQVQAQEMKLVDGTAVAKRGRVWLHVVVVVGNVVAVVAAAKVRWG